jgi:hypothetical protein
VHLICLVEGAAAVGEDDDAVGGRVPEYLICVDGMWPEGPAGTMTQEASSCVTI